MIKISFSTLTKLCNNISNFFSIQGTLINDFDPKNSKASSSKELSGDENPSSPMNKKLKSLSD